MGARPGRKQRLNSIVSRPVTLLSVATAVPETVLSQDEARGYARAFFAGRSAHFDRLEPVFANAGIERRHIARPPQWYAAERGWKERNDAYLEAADALYVEAAEKALAAAAVDAADVDVLVTVSTTGVATPSIEARVARRMGFRADAQRVPIFGLGCAGGVSGLAAAARLAERGGTVLFVTVEICSAAFRLDKLGTENIVATAIFGDGAASAVVRAGKGGVAQVGAGAELLWPDTLGIMGWDVEDPGLGVIFDRAIPPFVEQNMAAGVDAILSGIGAERASIERFICHPGGAKVIAALESSLALEEGSLDHERSVLRDFGNMSAPTVLFVLERALAAGLPKRALLLALGPGFTASGLLLDRA